MKKIIYLTLLVLSLSIMQGISPSVAEPYIASRQKKPDITPPGDVAMVFYKLSHQIPDFKEWALETKAYKEASQFNKPSVQLEQAAEMRDSFNLLTMQEPIIIENFARLSSYNHDRKGFFIENFKTDTFFPVHYAGQAYALIPEGIMDKQWLQIDDLATAKSIDDAAETNAYRIIRMIFFLSPTSADKTAPVSIDGEEYWLMSTKIKKMMISAPKGGTLLWRSDGSEISDQKHQELLNLYR